MNDINTFEKCRKLKSKVVLERGIFTMSHEIPRYKTFVLKVKKFPAIQKSPAIGYVRQRMFLRQVKYKGSKTIIMMTGVSIYYLEIKITN